jgi:O-antigen/teichoic acid export membrane protein
MLRHHFERGISLSNIQFRFLFISISAVIFLILVGIMIAEGSILGAIVSLIIFIGLVGYGFAFRAKLRKEGKF